jgi:parallel beta-helix repeat protein
LRRSVPLVAFATAVGAVLSISSSAVAAPSCDLFASTAGNDHAAGTLVAPLRTVQKLADSLAPGQTGCVRAGTYTENVAVSRPSITLTSYTTESATIIGRFWVKQGADHVTVSSLKLDAVNSPLPSPTVNGNDAVFSNVDVTSDRKQICFDIGNDDGWGRAERTTITGSRIHDCGAPGTNQIHGIYVVAADDTQIIDNVIYNNADRGVQLYPNAQRTTIRGNIIDGNGEGVIFSGDDGAASNGNVVENNIISNSQLRSNVESWYPAGNPRGTNNVVRNNCLWNGATTNVDTSGGGFTVGTNANVDPQFLDRAHGDYRLAAGSRCASVLAGSDAPASPAGAAPVGPVATAPAPSTPGTASPAPRQPTSSTPAPRQPTSSTPTTGHSTSTSSPSTGTPTKSSTKKPAKKLQRVCTKVRRNGKWTTRCAMVAKAAASHSAKARAEAKRAAAKRAAAKRSAARRAHHA